ncbi:thioredoxin [Shewanella sp. NFH-SH190041]|nr:thioredoxin [Shewanella sp. NFH-SH190041]
MIESENSDIQEQGLEKMNNTIKALLTTTTLFFSAGAFAGGCSFNNGSQDPNQIATCTQEDQEVILTGKITPQTLLELPEFADHADNYHPDQKTVAALKQINTPTDIVVIIGTWCPDCHRETPRFIRLMDAVDNPNITVTYIGVDRSKQDPDNLSGQYEFTRIPTFIVMQQGHEIGRIIERPKNSLEQDLLAILKR